MTDLAVQLRAASSLMAASGFRYAVVGGLAVSVHTEPRFTRDVDLAVSVDSDASAERLIREAATRGFRVFSLLEHDVAKRISTVRLRSDNGVLDLLFASSGIEGELVDEAEELEILPGVRTSVAGIPHLIALKLLARDDTTRPQDSADLARLRSVASDADLSRLRELCVLIEQRGYHRNRDLSALAADLIRSGRT